MRKLLRGVLVAAAVTLSAAGVVAYVRLVHPSNGTPLRWNNPAAVGIVVSSAGSDDIPDGSHETALRMAIQDWNAVTGTTATLVEDTSDASQARTDWSSTGIHLIFFDESNASGFFPFGSSTVAITPVWFFSSGLIQDADVLFNGSGFRFTTSGQASRFDVGAVGAHELGHLLGLDHSGAVGATLYPYVDTGLVLQRSLSQDDAHGLRDAYPQGTYGRIIGTIVRGSDSSAVTGAYVVARDEDGRTAASTLAGSAGAFTLRGLDPGVYTVYARPLDTPVDEGNLGSGHSGAETDFEPAVYASTATITAGEVIDLGALSVGDDVALNLGTQVDQFPARVIIGQTRTITLHGSGLFNGSTLTASDPDLLLGLPTWFGSQVTFQVTVPDGEARGHVDLMVTSAAGAVAILPAALEVTPPSPTVASVVPDSGFMSGGNALTITGAQFHPGARVVIGDQIYADGVTASVVDESTITLTTAQTVPGTHDVVVIDASGVEGRLVAAYAVPSLQIDDVLPAVGQATGGTEVVVAGEGFVDGLAVRIDGIDQGAVTVVPDGSEAHFTTVGGIAGGPYVLELENPDGSLTASSFSYAAQLDPSVATVTPASGSTAGGTTITIEGANFTGTTAVRFVAAPGELPVDAASVTFVDSATLEVVTPAHAAGTVGLLVEDAGGPGTFVEDAYTFSGGGGGGGGCAVAPLPAPPRPRAVLEGAWWLLAVLLLLGVQARRARVATVRRTTRS